MATVTLAAAGGVLAGGVAGAQTGSADTGSATLIEVTGSAANAPIIKQLNAAYHDIVHQWGIKGAPLSTSSAELTTGSAG